VNIQFTQRDLTVPANQPFNIEFVNNDANIPHNVEIFDSARNVVFLGEIFNGIETRVYQVPALEPGAYPFICTVHPNMTGTITAQ
jgi:plastocyanin